jgi:hypothetical protein
MMAPTEDDFTLCLAVVIFNMALGQHHTTAASEDISQRSKMMAKAETLYGMISRILFLNDYSALFGSHTALVVKLACVANLKKWHLMLPGNMENTNFVNSSGG